MQGVADVAGAGGRAAAWAAGRPRVLLALLCIVAMLPGFFALPPLDRDESRFVQATKQMLETGDLIDIRFQDDPRWKKPVGIHWMQAVAVTAAEPVMADARAAVWVYRIPSLAGAILAVLFAYQAGLALVGRGSAFIGAAALGLAAIVIGEAKIAKTDAALLSSIVAAQAALARVWIVARAGGTAPGTGNAVLFWAALGIGILIKGPIAPMVVGLTVLALVAVTRQGGWLAHLRPWPMALVMLAIVLPWMTAIAVKTGGAFFTEAIGADLAPKLAGTQERHGGPPGFYLVTVWATFFPGSLLLLPALWDAWRRRGEPAIAFLWAWLIPSWLVFEFAPTKLPHYTMPLYPALALMVGAYAVRIAGPARDLATGALATVSAGLWALVALLLAVAVAALPALYGSGMAAVPVLLALIILAMAALTLWLWRERQCETMLVAAAATAIALYAAVFGPVLSAVDDLKMSPRAAALVSAAAGGTPVRVAAAGYAEPSLVFLLGTDTILGTGAPVADALADGSAGLALVEAPEEEAFRATAAGRGLTLEALGTIEGIAYSDGDDRRTLTLWRKQP